MKSLFAHFKNLWDFKDRVDMTRLNFHTAPLAVELDLTNQCGHDCPWCLNKGFRYKTPTSLKSKIVFPLLKELKEMGVVFIVFSGGGEPLQHNQFPLFLQKAMELGLKTGLITNGEGLLKNIETIRKCDFVEISLDAGGYETHKKLHKSDPMSYSNIIQGIKKLTNVTVSFLANAQNYFEIPRLIESLLIIGVKKLHIKPAIIKGYTLSKRLEDEIFEMIESQKELLSGGKLEVSFDPEYFQESENMKCFSQGLVSVVCADSNVYLCPFLRGKAKFSLGDLREQSFKAIWEGAKRKEIFSQLDVSRCPSCRYKEYNRIINALNRKEMNYL